MYIFTYAKQKQPGTVKKGAAKQNRIKTSKRDYHSTLWDK